MTLKRKNTFFNAISVPKLVENEVFHYSLGLLCQKLKNQFDNVYFGGHLGFGGHFDRFLTTFRFVTGHHSIWHIKMVLLTSFHILSTKTTVGQHISTSCPGHGRDIF